MLYERVRRYYLLRIMLCASASFVVACIIIFVFMFSRKKKYQCKDDYVKYYSLGLLIKLWKVHFKIKHLNFWIFPVSNAKNKVISRLPPPQCTQCWEDVIDSWKIMDDFKIWSLLLQWIKTDWSSPTLSFKPYK